MLTGYVPGYAGYGGNGGAERVQALLADAGIGPCCGGICDGMTGGGRP